YRFDGRSRQPAKDGFNAVLNYSYGVLYSLVERACVCAKNLPESTSPPKRPRLRRSHSVLLSTSCLAWCRSPPETIKAIHPARNTPRLPLGTVPGGTKPRKKIVRRFRRGGQYLIAMPDPLGCEFPLWPAINPTA